MKSIFILLFLFIGSCTPGQIKIFEDAAEGELKIIENVVEDVAGMPRERPSVTVVQKRF